MKHLRSLIQQKFFYFGNYKNEVQHALSKNGINENEYKETGEISARDSLFAFIGICNSKQTQICFRFMFSIESINRLKSHRSKCDEALVKMLNKE